MDYYKNADKLCTTSDDGLYNSVLDVAFSGEGDEPVTLQELKDWGKIELSDDDAIVTALGKAARRVCESFTGLSFITRTVTATIINANGGFRLPYGPVTSDVTVTDSDGLWSDLRGEYEVAYDAGYNPLPEDLATALKAQFLFMYENRGESNVGLSPIAKMILEPLRTVL